MKSRLVEMNGSKPFTLFLLTFAVIGVAATFATIFVAGIGWDALFEVRAMTAFASVDGSQTLDDVRNVVPEQDVARGVWIFYVAQMLMLVTTGQPVLSADSPDAYAMLGFVSALVGVLASALIGFVIWLVTRNRVAGLLAIALLFSTPLWVGISGVAYRDAPIAAGLTLVSAGTLLVLTATHVHRRGFLIFSLVSLGSLLAVGSRAGAVALVIALSVLALVPLIFSRVRSGVSVSSGILQTVSGLLVGIAVAVAINPVARLNPIDWLIQSVLLSQSNPTTMLVKVMSFDVMSNELPVWYVPAYVLAQLPLGTLAALALALISLTFSCFQHAEPRAVSRETDAQPSVVIAWPFVVQGLLLPLIVVLAGSNIYDGLRHVLFLMPPLLILISLAFAIAPTDVWRMSIGLVAAVAVFLGSWATLRWFPYSYAFVNPIAGVVDEPRIWELDYWGLSAREGVTRLRDAGASTVFATPTANTSIPWGGTEPSLGQDLTLEGDTGWYVFERWAADLPDQCPVDFEIRRDGHLLGRGGMCSTVVGD